MYNLISETINNIDSEILSYETASELKIVILPGNPGIGSMYIELANALIDKTNGNVNIYMVSYAGFTKKDPKRSFNLQEELEHKMEVLRFLKSRWTGNFKLVILGHSIGSYLAKESAKILKQELNPTIFMLFPFITKSDNGPQVNFSKFLANANYTNIALASYKVFQKLPKTIIISLIKLLYSHAGEKAIDLIMEYFISEDHILNNIFYLANNEFEVLKDEIDLDYFQANQDNTVLLYCPDDMWAPLSQYEFIKENVPKIKGEVLPLITHDFCVNTNQSVIIAEKILQYL